MKKLFFALVMCLTATPAWAQVAVTGEANVSVVPNCAHITVGVVTNHEQASSALDANTTASRKMRKSLEDYNIQASDIKTVEFGVSPKYTQKKNDINAVEYVQTGYTVSNQVTVTVRQMDTLGKVLDAVVKNGANRVHSISFEYSDPREVLDKARKAAVADARRKAELYATALGAKLGPVVTVQESEARRQPHVYSQSASMRTLGDVPVSAGSQLLSVKVVVVWDLAKPAGAKPADSGFKHPIEK